jgi:hypothetical protein
MLAKLGTGRLRHRMRLYLIVEWWCLVMPARSGGVLVWTRGGEFIRQLADDIAA